MTSPSCRTVVGIRRYFVRSVHWEEGPPPPTPPHKGEGSRPRRRRALSLAGEDIEVSDESAPFQLIAADVRVDRSRMRSTSSVPRNGFSTMATPALAARSLSAAAGWLVIRIAGI